MNDNVQGAIRPRAVSYQCPNCDGVLEFDAVRGKLVCKHCGNEFDESEHGQVDMPVGEEQDVAPQAAEHVTDVEGFLDRTTWGGADAEELVGASLYSCPSCGASVTADQSVVSTSCPYCCNNMLLSGIATKANLPTYILPFSLTKEQAQEKMLSHLSGKWYLSRKFSASVEHVQGVYVPYYLYDIDVVGRADLIAYHTVQLGKIRSSAYYAMQRAGHASFERVPADGSSKMPDGHMDAIAPFSLDAALPFSPDYVAGYLMEVPDETPESCFDRVKERARASFREDLQEDARSDWKIDGVSNIVREVIDVTCTNHEICALPVWLLHCTWDGNHMLFAVNGETGRCVGDLPVDAKRRFATIAGIALGVAMLAGLLLVALLKAKADGVPIVAVCLFSILTILLAPLIANGYFMGQMRTAVEADDASDYYAGTGTVVTHRWCSRKWYSSEEKALWTLYEGEQTVIPGRSLPEPLPWSDDPASIPMTESSVDS